MTYAVFTYPPRKPIPPPQMTYGKPVRWTMQLQMEYPRMFRYVTDCVSMEIRAVAK